MFSTTCLRCLLLLYSPSCPCVPIFILLIYLLSQYLLHKNVKWKYNSTFKIKSEFFIQFWNIEFSSEIGPKKHNVVVYMFTYSHVCCRCVMFVMLGWPFYIDINRWDPYVRMCAQYTSLPINIISTFPAHLIYYTLNLKCKN